MHLTSYYPVKELYHKYLQLSIAINVCYWHIYLMSLFLSNDDYTICNVSHLKFIFAMPMIFSTTRASGTIFPSAAI